MHRSTAALSVLLLVACAAPLPPPDPPPPPPPDSEPRPLAIPVTPPGPLVIATEVPPPPPPAPVSGCALRLTQVGRSGCTQLPVLVARADRNSAEAASASDGNTCTVWRSGAGAPGSVTFDLGAETRIDVIALVPEMTGGGSVAHEIAFSNDGQRFEVGQRVEAPMQNGVPAELPLPKPEKARFVRITTTKSPSAPAWREVGLFRCGL